MWRHSHPLIYSDNLLVLFGAPNPGDRRIQPADFGILLLLLMARPDAAPADSGEMANSDLPATRPPESRRGLGSGCRRSGIRRLWIPLALAGSRSRHAWHRSRSDGIRKNHTAAQHHHARS